MEEVIKEIESIIEDKRYKTSTKIECIESIIDERTDENGSLDFDEFVKINGFFNDYLYGGVKSETTIESAIQKIDSKKG
jgi:hypothetical protein